MSSSWWANDASPATCSRWYGSTTRYVFSDTLMLHPKTHPCDVSSPLYCTPMNKLRIALHGLARATENGP